MKNIIKKVITLTLVLAALTIWSSSCNFLNVDDYFAESLKYDSIFTNRENIERYLWAIPTAFPDEGDYTRNIGSFASDEVFSINTRYLGTQFVLGNISPTSLGASNIWNNMYDIIRRANTVITNIHQAGMTQRAENEILCYAYFIRAYAYYNLLMWYGPVVIVGDTPMETNLEIEDYDRQRATFHESVDYICAEFEKAALHLEYEVPLSFFGRPTKGAAWGLIARLRLIQASPLWNGGNAARRTFGAWTRITDNVHYVSQVEEKHRWATAAMASLRIIETERYDLHIIQRRRDDDALPLPESFPVEMRTLPWPDGAANVDPYRSYADMFNGESLPSQIEEFLWARPSGSLSSFTQHAFPVRILGGQSTISVPQKMVDQYRMVDGHDINNSSLEYPYTTASTVGGTADKIISGYRLRPNVSNMYNNREARFYASIGFNGAWWPCLSSSGAELQQNRQFFYYRDGNAGEESSLDQPYNVNMTGYTMKKYIHDDDAWGVNDGSRRISKTYPIIRYAEILLSYVEALNNLPDEGFQVVDPATGATRTIRRDVAEMKKYFDLVRWRAGLPGPTITELNDVEEVQKLIEQERMVEFFMENIRHFDVRRWGKYELYDSQPITGMNIQVYSSSPSQFFQETPVNHSRIKTRVVDRRLILLPIDLNEVRKSKSMDQNPGYQN